jgi:hypothetical protein
MPARRCEDEIVTPETMESFTRLLATRLSVIVPSGFPFEVRDGTLHGSRDRWWGGVSFDMQRLWRMFGPQFPGAPAWYAGGYEERLVLLTDYVLDGVQDGVSEATGDAWPGTTEHPPSYAEVRDGILHFGYGDPAAPVLECEPILLSDLVS